MNVYRSPFSAMKYHNKTEYTHRSLQYIIQINEAISLVVAAATRQ